MSKRSLISITFAALVGATGCVARHAPWQQWGRSHCDDVEEQVDRDRERVAALEASQERPDQLEWYRNDLKSALREQAHCKQAAANASAANGGSR